MKMPWNIIIWHRHTHTCILRIQKSFTCFLRSQCIWQQTISFISLVCFTPWLSFCVCVCMSIVGFWFYSETFVRTNKWRTFFVHIQEWTRTIFHIYICKRFIENMKLHGSGKCTKRWSNHYIARYLYIYIYCIRYCIGKTDNIKCYFIIYEDKFFTSSQCVINEKDEQNCV